MGNEIIIQNQSTIQRSDNVVDLIIQRISMIRPELNDNPYIIEAIRVLPVSGYRSAIGSLWNAVVDDLRKKLCIEVCLYLIRQ